MIVVTLIDSPFANVANIARALRTVGAKVHLTRDASDIARAEKIVLPGVGSFPAAMQWVTETGIASALNAAARGGSSILGICVGHQLLFEASEEVRLTPGLGLISGVVRKLASVLPVPQIGWNRVRFSSSPLFAGVRDASPFYFVNSYAAVDVADQIAAADYGATFTAAIQRGNVYGVQFHPEKSSTEGLRVLANFVEQVPSPRRSGERVAEGRVRGPSSAASRHLLPAPAGRRL